MTNILCLLGLHSWTRQRRDREDVMLCRRCGETNDRMFDDFRRRQL